MPTEITRRSAPTIRRAKASSTSPIGLPLTIAALLILALHLVSGVVFDRSHASHAAAPAASGAANDETDCVVDAKPPETSLPYD
jgi:hypothetical protein